MRTLGFPAATITRLQRGDLNRSKDPACEVLLRHKLLFRIEPRGNLYQVIDQLKRSAQVKKYTPRFIVVTNFQKLLAIDSDDTDSLDCKFSELADKYVFFLPLAGINKQQIDKENAIDFKVAQQIAELHSVVEHDNPEFDRHPLNVFFARLLFCFFAEDTAIFAKNLFTESIASHTQANGSDLDSYLQRLFARLNDSSSNYPEYLQKFPYTNGGLFDKELPLPKFSRTARKVIIDCGKLHWQGISPDIFGSIFQAAIDQQDRDKLGAHYTSPENIRKVIKPLFLDDLYRQLEQAGDSKKKLEKLLIRLSNLRIFDPACGSGNFLIVTYRELRQLEMKIFDKLYRGQRLFTFASSISLKQFYGIEIIHFACEIAKLSLYLSEHLLNLEFERRFLHKTKTLPLKDSGQIVHGNALQIDWQQVCPHGKDKEVYVIGNPPYAGRRYQKSEQKADKDMMLSDIRNYKSLDYVACWFYRGAHYIKDRNAQLAFVATNSISQGQQVPLLWPPILNLQVEISFAYRSFKWTNKAKGNAGITCVIIGLRNKSDKAKYLYTEDRITRAKNINPYLVDGEDVVIVSSNKSLANSPKTCMGNMAIDGGNLLLEPHEKQTLTTKFPASKKFFRKIKGAREFTNSIERWCLWISDHDLPEALAIPEIKARIDRVKKFRLISTRKSTKTLAKCPHRFDSDKSAKKFMLVIPQLCPPKRPYMPAGFLSSKEVISNILAIYDPPIYIFALITSSMHMVWVKNFAGRLEERIRYSSDLCYNTFPFPELSEQQRYQLAEHTRAVIEAREQHSEKTLAQLYDPATMPANLRQAHDQLDRYVEGLYQAKPFIDDDQRLACLLSLYGELTAGQGS